MAVSGRGFVGCIGLVPVGLVPRLGAKGLEREEGEARADRAFGDQVTQECIGPSRDKKRLAQDDKARS